MAWGRAEICLPPWALEQLGDSELSSVIAHETAHLERRDPFWLLMVALTTRVFWFQPFNRLAGSRLEMLAEYLCDDHACLATGSRLALAGALARVAALIQGRSQFITVAIVADDSLAVKRVQRILQEDRRISSPSAGWTALLASLSPLVILGLFGPRVSAAPSLAGRYTISAVDDAGPFALTLEGGRVRQVSMNGASVPSRRIEQNGRTVRITGEAGSSFEITLTSRGGMSWQSRSAGWGN
jgi:hypothetical protein